MRLFQFLILGILLSCGQNEQNYFNECIEEDSGFSFVTHVDSSERFSLEIPQHLFVRKPYSYFKYVAWDTAAISDTIVHTLAVEHYNLKDKTFDEFYADIKMQTDSAMATSTGNNRTVERLSSRISSRDAKISTTTITQSGFQFYNTQFYIKNEDRVFVVSIGTTQKDYQNINCLFKRSIESIKSL